MLVRDRAVDVISWVAFVAICCAMLLTVGDVATRAAGKIVQWSTGVHPGWGLFGLVDLTQLAMMAAMPLAIAAAFIAGTHIRVDLILHKFTQSGRNFLTRLAALAGFVLMGVCLWSACAGMLSQLSFVTTSATLGIAYTWYWLPLIGGLALSVLGCAGMIIWPKTEVPLDV